MNLPKTGFASETFYLRIKQLSPAREVSIGNIKRRADLDHCGHLCREDYHTVKEDAAEARRSGSFTLAPYLVQLVQVDRPEGERRQVVDQDYVGH